VFYFCETLTMSNTSTHTDDEDVNAWFPDRSCLEKLPYVRAFQPLDSTLPDSLFETLLDEHMSCLAVEGLKKERSLTKDERERQKEAVEKATKAIGKQYRRASIKIHPDRFGDDYQKEFELLQKAYNVLNDADQRRNYLDELFNICQVIDNFERQHGYSLPARDQDRTIQETHHQWVKRHAEKPKEKRRPASRPLQLEGGLSTKRPRNIIIESIDPKHKRAHVALPAMEPLWEFYESCHEIHILAEDGGHDVPLKTIPRNIILKRKDMATIRVEIELPDHSYWPVVWFAVMKLPQFDGTFELQDTPRSMDRVVDTFLPEQRALIERKPTLISLARQSVGKLRALLHHMTKHEGSLTSLNAHEVETSYWTLHQTVSKSRSDAAKLSKCLQLLHIHSCPELTKLLEVLEEAIPPKLELERVLQGKRKKNELKVFKWYVAGKLEAGEAAEWMASVTEDELVELGGQSNRLYQLLAEGKKANSLAVDPDTLQAAACRTDFFTPKQCERLLKIRDEAEERWAAEAVRLMKEEKARELEENYRREMEERAKLMPRGTYVKLKGLKHKPELNGALGVYMGLGEGQGRYVIQLLDGNKEVALLKDNFEKHDLLTSTSRMASTPVVITPSWTCVKCTFLHEGPLANMSHCSMCETAKDAKVDENHGSLPSPKPLPPQKQTHAANPSQPKQQHHLHKQDHQHHGHKKSTTGEVTMYIKPELAGEFIGRGGAHIREREKQSGARIFLVKENSADGMRAVHLKGSPAAVKKAEALVEDFISAHSRPPEPTHAKPLPKSESTQVPHASQTRVNTQAPQSFAALNIATAGVETRPVPPKPSSTTEKKPVKQPVGSATNDNLLEFLHTQKACFKCPVKKFHAWLKSEDIVRVDDLAEAVIDEDFVRAEMQANGLKVAMCIFCRYIWLLLIVCSNLTESYDMLS